MYSTDCHRQKRGLKDKPQQAAQIKKKLLLYRQKKINPR
jgi:hypothetical protein